MTGRVAVVGAGLVGSLLAIFLTRRGYRVDVYERRADLRGRELPAGRSINLTLCTRGLRALERAGVAREVAELTVPVHGRMMHDEAGRTTFQPYGNRREAIHSISRNDLNRRLVDVADARHGVRFHFEERCLGIDLDRPALELQDERSGRVHVEEVDVVLGADGAFSTVRQHLQRTDRFDFSQHYVRQAYKELPAPAAPGGRWRLEPHALHIWPRGRYMLIGFPNLDASFTLALHLPFEGDPSFEAIRTEADLQALFAASFPDALDLVPNLAECYFAFPTTSMITVRCAPWSYGGRVALVGDAAHAIVPSYGQGANCGFEDCAVLDRCLDLAGDDWAAALAELERLRRPNADAVADLSLEHFRELQDLVGEDRFLLRKAVERRIDELFPGRFAPLYNMVSFTELSYLEALDAAGEQRRLVDRVLALEDLEARLAAGEADREIAALVEAGPLAAQRS